MFTTKIKRVLAVVLVVGLALGGIVLGVGLPTNQVAQAETPREAPVKKGGPASPATKKDGAKEREPAQIEAKAKPLVVHAVLESVDAKAAVITVKWVTGSDPNAAFMLFVARGEAFDPRTGFQASPETMRRWLDAHPRFVNVPVRPGARIVSGKGALQLKDLRAGSVVSLQLEADPIRGVAIVGIGVTDLADLTLALSVTSSLTT